jgi:hypothetical protein
MIYTLYIHYGSFTHLEFAVNLKHPRQRPTQRGTIEYAAAHRSTIKRDRANGEITEGLACRGHMRLNMERV